MSNAPFSDALLRQAAGPRAYDRGAAYHKEGRVELLSQGDGQVLARVHGSETYRVALRTAGGGPHGSCSCPAFDDTDCCKHMVAVALSANQVALNGAAPADRLSAVRRYLQGQSVEALAERLLRQALDDPELLEELELDAANAAEDDETLVTRYRAAIDAACDTGGYVDWRGAGDYADQINRVVERLGTLVAGGRSALALSLLDHLFEEMEDAYEAVDDSEGEIGGALARAEALHLEACRQARPDPVALARALFERELGGSWNVFEDAVRTYAEVLGPKGLAEYRRLATEAWNGPRAERSWALRSTLDWFAEQDGDLEARIALRKADLKAPTAYIEIARLYREANQKADALKWIEEALWCFEDRPEERLHTYAAELMIEAGRQAEAESLLWAAFERWPSLGLYRRLQGLAAVRDDCMRRALDILRPQAAAATGPGGFWSTPAVVMLEIQTAEGQMTEAWETAEAFEVGDERLKALANATAASHPQAAARAYERLVERCVGRGGNDSYDAAIALIKRRAAIGEVGATLADYLADLAVRHKMKRNFIARLRPLL